MYHVDIGMCYKFKIFRPKYVTELQKRVLLILKLTIGLYKYEAFFRRNTFFLEDIYGPEEDNMI